MSQSSLSTEFGRSRVIALNDVLPGVYVRRSVDPGVRDAFDAGVAMIDGSLIHPTSKPDSPSQEGPPTHGILEVSFWSHHWYELLHGRPDHRPADLECSTNTNTSSSDWTPVTQVAGCGADGVATSPYSSDALATDLSRVTANGNGIACTPAVSAIDRGERPALQEEASLID
jgi:hypothetical protein